MQQAVPLKTVVWEIIKTYGFHATQVDEVIKLFNAANGSYVQSATHRIIRNRKWLIIAANVSGMADVILIEHTDKKISFENGELSFEELPAVQVKMNPAGNIALLDVADIKYPLLLRKWKQGDYFYPLGMPSKKKLSRFFIDQKLSKTAKEQTWVLEMDKKIIWVVRLRIDDRFKLKPGTEKVLHIQVV